MAIVTTTTTSQTSAPAATPAISARLSLITGVVVLVAAIVGVALVNIVRPAQAGSSDTVILTLAVPAVAGLFLAARVNYAAGSVLANQEAHTQMLTTVQTQLNGTLDARIATAVEGVLQAAGLIGQAIAAPPPAAPAQPATQPPAVSGVPPLMG